MEIRKRTQALLLMAAVSGAAMAQGTVVTGIVQDDRNVPITGATVCQINTSNCTAADRNGIFHLLLEQGEEMNLQVKCLGFNPVEVALDESTAFPVRVTLIPAFLPGEIFGDESYYNDLRVSLLRSTMGLDALFTDFTEFVPELGTHNTEVMDYFAVIGPELGARLSGFSFGIGLGLGYSYKNNYDTLIVDLNNTMFKMNLGYDIVSSRRMRVTPFVSLRWLRFCLENYSGERKITLGEYLSERDINLRFNQTIAVAGLNIEYLMYSGAPGNSDFWSFGLAGGYAAKLNRIPWVYSRGNRIMTDNTIGLSHLTFGLSVSYYMIIRE